MRRRKISARTANRLQDEVCRQMLRLEAGRPSAHLLLAIALLNAWIMLERQPPDCEPRQWLRRLTPVCLRMIEEAGGANGGSCFEESLASTQHPASQPEKIP
jgi:hypothetical protein